MNEKEQNKQQNYNEKSSHQNSEDKNLMSEKQEQNKQEVETCEYYCNNNTKMGCRLSLYCNDWNLDCSKNVNCEIKLLAQAREENEKLQQFYDRIKKVARNFMFDTSKDNWADLFCINANLHVEEYAEENKNLKAEKKDLNTIIDRLLFASGENQCTASAEDFEEAYENIESKISELDDLRTENNDLTSRIGELEADLKPFQDDYFKGLSYEAIAELAKKSIRLGKENGELVEQIVDLNNQIYELKTESGEL